MNADDVVQGCLEHTLFSWSARGKLKPLPIERALGVYIYGADGQRWLDFNSQLMSVNIGHSHPKVVQAIKDAADGLLYAYPGAATQARADLGRRLAAMCPGDLNTFFFTLGGAEANENAIKLVRQSTGRFKILSRYRSYHGATNATMQLTGDPRRWANEPGAPGFIRVLDPKPISFSFGSTDEEITTNNLRYLEEIIVAEGSHTIAAMFIETVTGTNGILAPPRGYLKGLRALLDKYGILLVCDEVMAGFGRTGKLFAFQHGDIVPDVLTMAKGLTSSYVPLGAVAVSDKIAHHFDDNVFYGGLTYNAHSFCMNVAMACLDVMEEEGLVENSARMGLVMREEMDRLQAAHPSVKEGRNIGLFGILDLQRDRQGTDMAPFNGSHPVMPEINRFLLDNGLFTFIHWGSVMCNPPLCITEEQLREGFSIIDRALNLADAAMDDA